MKRTVSSNFFVNLSSAALRSFMFIGRSFMFIGIPWLVCSIVLFSKIRARACFGHRPIGMRKIFERLVKT